MTHSVFATTLVALSALFTYLRTPVATDFGTNAVGHETSRRTTVDVKRDGVTIVGIATDGESGQLAEGVTVSRKGGANNTGISTSISTSTNSKGEYSLQLSDAKIGDKTTISFRRIGYRAQEISVRLTSDTVAVNARLTRDVLRLESVTTTGVVSKSSRQLSTSTASVRTDAPDDANSSPKSAIPTVTAPPAPPPATPIATPPAQLTEATMLIGKTAGVPNAAASPPVSNNVVPGDRRYDREQYDRINDNAFLSARQNALSTFSIDVDRASYGNVRDLLNRGALPPKDAVRIEEFINYFPYDLPQPRGNAPVAITTEVGAAPWQPKHRLVRVALQARAIEAEKLPPNNLVFLIDVSGSMDVVNKLPLVKQSLRLLVKEMREQDRIAIVVYAGAAGLVLPSTSGENKSAILQAIERLRAGGSTAGGAGLMLAYSTARENFIQEGNNRVILATDGDFNVGVSSDAELERLIESKRKEGTYLTVLGFGRDNIQDAKMEKMAKQGNGNYAYIDDIREAHKTLVREMGGTLVTVANDVKLQIEFNPAVVQSYRLIGYENRLMRNEDFRNDRKDAGDIGAGHSVTALYEVIPVDTRNPGKDSDADELRYASNESDVRGSTAEMMFVKLRYKRPGDARSKEISQAVRNSRSQRTSDDFRFAASVASFGMLLRDSEFKGNATAEAVIEMARGALGQDVGQYRSGFLELVHRWNELSAAANDRR